MPRGLLSAPHGLSLLDSGVGMCLLVLPRLHVPGPQEWPVPGALGRYCGPLFCSTVPEEPSGAWSSPPREESVGGITIPSGVP